MTKKEIREIAFSKGYSPHYSGRLGKFFFRKIPGLNFVEILMKNINKSK